MTEADSIIHGDSNLTSTVSSLIDQPYQLIAIFGAVRYQSTRSCQLDSYFSTILSFLPRNSIPKDKRLQFNDTTDLLDLLF